MITDFQQELWNEKIESIKQRTLNELGVVQEPKWKDRETLNKININKKSKGLDRIRKPGNEINNSRNLP